MTIPRALAVAAALMLVACLATASAGDEPPPAEPPPAKPPPAEPPPAKRPCVSINGVELNLPIVPEKEPRDEEGPGDDEKWQLGRGVDSAPVASFIDTLKGNDAAITVVLDQGKLLTLKKPLGGKEGTGLIAVGDPTVIDFQVLPNPRMIRLIGRRPGVTDLSLITADGETVNFEVRVVYDLDLLRARLRQVFPDARLKLAQIRDHVVVEGEAPNIAQVNQIIKAIGWYLQSLQVTKQSQAPTGTGGGAPMGPQEEAPRPGDESPRDLQLDLRMRREQQRLDINAPPAALGEREEQQLMSYAGVGGPSFTAEAAAPQIINLIQVPGIHQVTLQVRVAELNRTAIRNIGADLLGVRPAQGTVFGTTLGNGTVNALANLGLGGLAGGFTPGNVFANAGTGASTTAFGIFPRNDFAIVLNALRQNNLLNILAEPNLTVMSGQAASFLAGGQFPVPVPQVGGAGFNTVTIRFKNFGVQLYFVPVVVDEGKIRLTVAPEVSTIDFTLGTTLVTGGKPVPGLNTRRAATTVELSEGQTLAIAGLLQVTITGSTLRIPGLGDLPVIGPMFSNTSLNRTEKELMVMVTPYLVEPMEADEVPPYPGQEIVDPSDLEFYLLNRIEGRTGRPYRATTQQIDPPRVAPPLLKLERQYIHGPVGHSD